MPITDEQNEQIDLYYREMHNKLYAYAFAALKNSALAEEAVQDTFVVACKKPDALLTSPNPRGWLVNTLKYSISTIRKSQHQIKMLLLSLNPMEDGSVLDDPDDAISYIASLSLCQSVLKDDYELFMRIAIDRCSMLEAATEFNISVEACKKRIQRARSKLRIIFEQE